MVGRAHPVVRDNTMFLAMQPPDEYVEVFEPRDEPQRPERASRHVDFASVPPSQWAMHDRLINWSRWARGGSGESARAEPATPMFRLFRSSEAKRAYGEETTVPVDKDDAIRVAKAVGHLPPQKRYAIHWCYLQNGRHPAGKARDLGLELQQLADLVRDARAMLMGWV